MFKILQSIYIEKERSIVYVLTLSETGATKMCAPGGIFAVESYTETSS
jgi:hypothetical protein